MPKTNQSCAVLRGIFLLLGMHIIAMNLFPIVILLLEGISLIVRPIIPISVLQYVSPLPYGYLVAIGVLQLIYVIPMVRRLARREQWDVLKGFAIGAIATLLLNGSGYILLLLQPQ